jgi:hypothetical protein
VPENRDVLLHDRGGQRYLQTHSRCARDARTAAALHPLQPPVPGARPLPCGDCAQAAAAIDAFLRGVNINPALPASWKASKGLYRMTGQAATPPMPPRTSPRWRNCRPKS